MGDGNVEVWGDGVYGWGRGWIEVFGGRGIYVLGVVFRDGEGVDGGVWGTVG